MKIFNYPKTKITTNLEGFSFSDNTVSFINLFLASIKNVKSQYLNFEFKETTYNPECVKNKGSIDHVERVFAYELYHQWSKKLKNNDWILNGEAGKYLQWFYLNRDKASMKQKFPDLVQYYKDNHIDEPHMIVCEIKRDYSDNIKKGIRTDLLKLYGFTCSNNDGRWFESYKCGIFLVIGDNCSVIQDSLGKNIIRRNGTWKLFKHIPSDEAKKIICVLCDEKDGKINVRYQSLYNIVEEKLNNRKK